MSSALNEAQYQRRAVQQLGFTVAHTGTFKDKESKRRKKEMREGGGESEAIEEYKTVAVEKILINNNTKIKKEMEKIKDKSKRLR
jgi:hypothetical protein